MSAPKPGNPFSKEIVMKTSTPAQSFLEWTGTDMVHIYVGAEKRLFTVYKKVLCDKVPYFDKMFRSGFKESIESTATLPEDDPDAFDTVITWVHCGATQPLVYTNIRKGDLSWPAYVAYGLAEKLCMDKLKESILRQVKRLQYETNTMCSLESLYTIYGCTHDGSMLRKYAAKQFCHYIFYQHKSTAVADLEKPMGEIEDLRRDVLLLLRDHAVWQPPRRDRTDGPDHQRDRHHEYPRPSTSLDTAWLPFDSFFDT